MNYHIKHMPTSNELLVIAAGIFIILLIIGNIVLRYFFIS